MCTFVDLVLTSVFTSFCFTRYIVFWTLFRDLKLLSNFRGVESDGSLSSVHGRSKKLKRYRDKKSKKNKKSKYKLRSKSKSPSRKRKKYVITIIILAQGALFCYISIAFSNHFRHRSRSRSGSTKGKTCHESVQKFVTYTIPPSVEAVMEKVIL